LWFSDFYAAAVKSVSAAGDLRTEFEIDDRRPDSAGCRTVSLLVVSMTKRQLLRRAKDGKMAVHADLSGVGRLPLQRQWWSDSAGAARNVGRLRVRSGRARNGRPAAFCPWIADHPTAKLAVRAADDGVVARLPCHPPCISPVGSCNSTPDGKYAASSGE
jgi:hypothetical protein